MAAKQLPLFDGKAVHKASVRITKTGDGLSEAFDLDPNALELGQHVCFVVRGIVTQVNHRTKGDAEDGEVNRQHTVAAEDIAIIDPGVADKMISAEKDRLQRLKDERDGQERLGLNEDAPKNVVQPRRPFSEEAGLPDEDEAKEPATV
ncbi:MAG: hypothetical protein KGR26_11185 [Cyanobacteria bacterium REEB65]|nr:hypothetical protein [Cyanobacteria bacterium REEB65]